MIRARRAVSILELLVVMSACTVVLTLTSVLIVRALRVHMQATAYGDAERSALRFADQFRADVHRAQSVRVAQSGGDELPFLQLQSADGRQTSYTFVHGIVRRSTALESKRIAREEFSFPAASKLVVRELQSPLRVEVTIATSGRDIAASENPPRSAPALLPVGLHILACVGRDLGLTSALLSEDKQ